MLIHSLQAEQDAHFILVLARAYSAAAGRLTDKAEIKERVSQLRTLLKTKNIELVDPIATAYASLAIKVEGSESDTQIASPLLFLIQRREYVGREIVKAYSALAGAMFLRANSQGRTKWVKELLTLAGTPYLDDAPIFSALNFISGRDFGEDINLALLWAEQTYQVHRDELRPAPVDDVYGLLKLVPSHEASAYARSNHHASVAEFSR